MSGPKKSRATSSKHCTDTPMDVRPDSKSVACQYA